MKLAIRCPSVDMFTSLPATTYRCWVLQFSVTHGHDAIQFATRFDFFFVPLAPVRGSWNATHVDECLSIIGKDFFFFVCSVICFCAALRFSSLCVISNSNTSRCTIDFSSAVDRQLHDNHIRTHSPLSLFLLLLFPC